MGYTWEGCPQPQNPEWQRAREAQASYKVGFPPLVTFKRGRGQTLSDHTILLMDTPSPPLPPSILSSSSRRSPVLFNFPLYSLPTGGQTEPEQCYSSKITKCFIHISVYTTEQHFTCPFCTAKDINIQL